jgi:hypothetical protein
MIRRMSALAALGLLLAVPLASAEEFPGATQLARGATRINTAESIWQSCGLSVPRCRHAAAVRIYSALQLVDTGAQAYFLNFTGCEYTNADAHRFQRAQAAFLRFAQQPTTPNGMVAVNAMADYRRPLANKIRHCHL